MWNDNDINFLIDNYKNKNIPIKIFEDTLKRNWNSIKAKATKLNLERYEKPNKNLDVNYFKVIDTEEKAYFLGLIFGDGNLYKGNCGYKVSLQFEKTEKYILERFKKCINSNNNLYLSKDKKNFALFIHNKKFYENIEMYNIMPNKRKYCDSIPTNINKKFMRYFIKGFFDADGNIYNKTKDKYKNNYSLSVTKNKQIIKSLMIFINNELGFMPKIWNPINKPYSEMRIYNRENVNIFMNYIYKDSNIHFERKFKKYIEILNIKENLKNTNTRLTKSDIEYIEKNWRKESKIISNEIGKCINSINKYKKKFCILNNYYYKGRRKFTKYDDNIITEMKNNNKSYYEISKKLNREYNTVCERGRKLGYIGKKRLTNDNIIFIKNNINEKSSILAEKLNCSILTINRHKNGKNNNN